MIKRLTVTIEGKDDGDLEIALDEVSRLVNEGYQAGHNSNDTGAFLFDTDEVTRKKLVW